MGKKINFEGGFRSATEKEIGKRIENIFSRSPFTVETRLDDFPKYIKRQKLTRLLSLYEIFKKVIHVKGSVVECGVFRGSTLMAWANMSAVLEPNNITRRIYGFDSFEGYKSFTRKDHGRPITLPPKKNFTDAYQEISELILAYDQNRFLGHVDKVQLIKGDMTRTIPAFIKKNSHLVVSLLFLDVDLYKPTKTALKYFLPRMPKGAILAFDELDNPIWPGETLALLDTIGINKRKIERMDFDPYIGYIVI